MSPMLFRATAVIGLYGADTQLPENLPATLSDRTGLDSGRGAAMLAARKLELGRRALTLLFFVFRILRMKGTHPNSVLIVLALSTALNVGCTQKQLAGVPNPFLAPDQVPPPSTRTIAPGTAQPYYPGDPLPVMQSAAPGAAPPAVASVAPASVPSPNVAAAPMGEPQKIAFSNEPSVAVPSDESPLRFELPAPPEPKTAPLAATAPQPIAPSGPTVSNPTSPSAVVPAMYNAQPNGSRPTTAAVPAAAATDPVASGPWRSPQIVSAAPPAYAPATQPNMSPAVAQPAAMPGYGMATTPTTVPSSMNVSLRAVPSPEPPTPLTSSTPRIRIPGYPAPPVSTSPAPASNLGVSADGFRPRNSMH
jgi:hypothetical protein